MKELEINKIYNIDCLEGIKKIKSKSIKTIIADPPYFLGMTHNGQKGSFVDLAITKPFYKELFTQFKRVLTADGCVFMFCDFRSYALFYPIFDEVMNITNLIVWNKLSAPGNKYSYNHEFILFHGNKEFNNGGSNVWSIKGFSSGAKTTNGEKKIIPQKPKEVIFKMLMDTTQENDIILDPFTGSGTTAIVCRENKRNFIGFELDLKNFDICKNRIKEELKIIKLF